MQQLEELIVLAKPIYENFNDPSHDFAHINRVINLSKKIGEIEGANLDILLPAALLHDIVNIPKNHPDRSKASEMAADKASEMMSLVGYDQDLIARVHKAIVEHSFSRGEKPTSIEAAILQDSDRMDALGAIGIMRMVTVGTKFGANYYQVNDPLAKNRDFADKEFSLDHFYTKLFKLPELMNTDAARAEALRRADYMKDFIEQLMSEI